MSSTEKIANAKKRINELERLIEYWEKSDSNDLKLVNNLLKLNSKVA